MANLSPQQGRLPRSSEMRPCQKSRWPHPTWLQRTRALKLSPHPRGKLQYLNSDLVCSSQVRGMLTSCSHPLHSKIKRNREKHVSDPYRKAQTKRRGTRTHVNHILRHVRAVKPPVHPVHHGPLQLVLRSPRVQQLRDLLHVLQVSIGFVTDS